MKNTIWTVAIIVLLIVSIIFLANEKEITIEKKAHLYNYDIKVSKVGSAYYKCWSYERDKEAYGLYKIYDKNNKLTNEITVIDGYVVQISDINK